MGFTGVSWESRSTEQLARDLTTGPGPTSVGTAGAAWVRVANEYAAVSEDFDKILDRLRTAYDSSSASVALQKLEQFGDWLRATSLNAAANGQRAENAAVADTVAVLAMPTVAEAVEAKAAHDMMASLAAYNGAILNGTFAEFDEAAATQGANAAAVMAQYEDACDDLAQPWDQPPPPDICKGDALKAEKDAKDGKGSGGSGGAGGAGGTPMPLSPMMATPIKASDDAKAVEKTRFSGGGVGSAASAGGGYGPMSGMHRGDQNRDYESNRPAAALEGGGEEGAGVADGGQGWLPATAQSDAPFTVSNVSWGADTSVFDELAVPDAPAAPGFADEPEGALEQVSDRWVSPPVIGVDRKLSL
jgi:hypothetical protein